MKTYSAVKAGNSSKQRKSVSL